MLLSCKHELKLLNFYWTGILVNRQYNGSQILVQAGIDLKMNRVIFRKNRYAQFIPPPNHVNWQCLLVSKFER